MTAKEWLERGRGIDKEIEMLTREREAAFAAASRVCASYDTDKVQTSPGNTTERKLVNYAEYGLLIDRRIDELYAVKTEIMTAVGKIRDGTLRRLLLLRYVEMLTWEEIAEEMGYNVRQIHRIHGEALKKIGEFIPPRCTL